MHTFFCGSKTSPESSFDTVFNTLRCFGSTLRMRRKGGGLRRTTTVHNTTFSLQMWGDNNKFDLLVAIMEGEESGCGTGGGRGKQHHRIG